MKTDYIGFIISDFFVSIQLSVFSNRYSNRKLTRMVRIFTRGDEMIFQESEIVELKSIVVDDIKTNDRKKANHAGRKR